MTKAAEQFNVLAKEIPGAKVSKMFSATCIKAPNGKAVLMIYDKDLVFKLEGEALKHALSQLFNPMGNRLVGG